MSRVTVLEHSMCAMLFPGAGNLHGKSRKGEKNKGIVVCCDSAHQNRHHTGGPRRYDTQRGKQ